MERKMFCRKSVIVASAVSLVMALTGFADTYAYKVKYLESTRTGKQYINTGIIPDANTTVVVKYEYRGIAASGSSFDMIAGCTSPRYYPVSLNATTTDPKLERHTYGANASGKISQLESNEGVLKSHTIIFNDAKHGHVHCACHIVGFFNNHGNEVLR